MSKARYNILRFALGLFVGVLSLRAIRDFNALSISELVALAFGIFASVVNYLPEKKDTNNADRG